MAKLSLTRRSFLKAAAVTGAASTLSFAAAPSAALAEGVDESAGEVKRIRSCCRACGKCECGVWVTVQDNKVIKVEGDESNAHSRGHCCAKSQASMLALYHPDRLRYTMKRTNPKGEDDPGWVRVNFAEAMDEIGAKYNELIDKYGGKSIFSMGGTSRVWAQPPYGTLKSVFGTHNFHSAYEICKGPRHFGGVLTDEKGSPWMEVEQGPIVYVQWGTASEYSNYDSTNRTVVDCSQRAYKHILVDPRMSPLGKEADLWLPIRVGTDLAMSLGWLKWIVDNDAYDKNFVKRWSNGPFLYNPEADGKTYKGYFLEMNGGIHMTSRLLTEADLDREWVSQFWEPAPEQYSYRRFICWDAANEKPIYWDAEECQWEGEKHKIPTTGTWIEHPYKPIIADAWLPDPSKFADPADPAYDAYWTGEGNEKGAKSNPKGLPKDPELWPDGVQVKLKSGKMIEAKSVWQEWEHNLEEYTLERVSEITEVPADKIEEAVRTYTTRLNPLHGNGGIHYQLAPDQTGHAVQNTRALQLIACLTGNSDEPAGNRGSSKAQVDGCCGRANMIVTDHDPVDWGIREGIGTMELGNTPRDLSVEDQIPLIQNFVKYLQDENSPLMERYGNHIPTDEEARIIAMRKGGDYKGSRSFPGLKTPFENNADQISAERFPLLRFWNSWTDASSIWDAIREIDSPYKLYGGICMSGDFMNQSNLLEAWDALTQLDFWVDINLWSCPNNGTADYVFPCTHWLETNTGRVSQGAGGIFGAGQRCVEPIGDVVFDPTFVVCLHKSMGVPFNDRDPEYDEWLNLDYHDFIQAGGSVGYEEQEYRVLKDATDWWKTEEYPDGPDFPQYAAKFQEEGWFDCRKWHPERWGTYRRWEMGYRRQQAGYNLYAAVDEKCAFGTPTGKVEIWSTICESYIGDTVSESYVLETPGTAAKVGEKTPYFAQVCSPDRDAYAGDIPDIDKFPHWFEPKNSRVQAPEWYDANLVDGASYNSDNYLNKPYHGIAGVGTGQATDNGTTDNLEAYKQAVKENPEATFICTSGARQPVYFHSEHRQLPWCRELWPSPRFEMNPNDAARLGIEQGDWIWVRTPWGAIREVADLYYGIKEGTTNANHAWWYPEMDHAAHGFELVGINCTMDKYAQCWICGASQLRGNPMVVYKATEENSPFGNPVPCDPWGNEAITNANDPRLKEWLANDPRLDDSKVELTYASADAKGLQTISLIKE